jgi:hypothetical protein
MDFFKCTNGKIRIIDKIWQKDELDPIMERKRVMHWSQTNGLTLEKKIVPIRDKRIMQGKVDKLKIIKGFPKVVWDYCTFTPEDYEKRKENPRLIEAIMKFLYQDYLYNKAVKNLMDYMEPIQLMDGCNLKVIIFGV